MKRYLYVLTVLLSSFLYAQKSDFASINFDKADRIANQYENERLDNLPLLAYKLTNHLNTQVEKFRAIHTWVCLNIESDHNFGDKTIRKRKKFKNDTVAFNNWSNNEQTRFFQRLFNDKKTICSGYAYLIKELSVLADIKCEIVDGYSRTVHTNVNQIDIPNHSWNAVLIDNTWYFVDATLASGFFFVNENKFIKNYNDGYFLAVPELFSKSHYPLDEKWLILENTFTLNEFVEAPLVYSNTYKYNVIPVIPNKLVTQVSLGEAVAFSLKISDAIKIDDISLILSSGFRYEKIQASHSDFKNGIIKMKHRFTKKGHYDVHFKINEDIVVTYTIKVEKSEKVIVQNS